ncbi:MAG: amino acid adenylation domain-containing protein [Bacteroidota bacterium]
MSVINVESLIEQVNSRGATISMESGNLKLRAPKDVLNDDVIRQIQEHKQQLLDYLAEQQGLHQTILPIHHAGPYELSRAQKRLWIIQRLGDALSSYNMAAAYELTGAVDIEPLEKAFHDLVNRHEILRTNVIVVNDEPYQQVQPENNSKFRITRIDGDGQNIEECINKECSHEFDLEKESLFRVTLITISKGKVILVLNMHHIVSDGWSIGIIFGEVIDTYTKNDKPRPLKIQYKDYAAWQNNYIRRGEMRKAEAYWHSRFETETTLLQLPLDRQRHDGPRGGGSVRGQMDITLLTQLKQLGIGNITTFSVLHALTKILLYKYSSQLDITIGIPISGRDLPELNNQVGFYVNTLALRTNIDPTCSFGELLASITRETTEAFEFQEYPFDLLVNNLNLKRDITRNPLFDVMVIFRSEDGGGENSVGLPFEVTPLDLESTSSKFDLTFDFVEKTDSLTIAINYDSSLFDRSRISKMLSHFHEMVNEILRHTHVPVSSLSILTKSERSLLLDDLNADVDSSFFHDKEIDKQFQKIASRIPTKMAVSDEVFTFSYSELDELSNRIANRLHASGVKPGESVAMYGARSSLMVAAILGILKSGAAYVPMDEEYPVDRLSYMLSDSGCRFVISTAKEVPPVLRVVPFITLLSPVDLNTSPSNLKFESPADPGRIAYIIYTSGTTGMPKGVMITHRNLMGLLFHNDPPFNLSEDHTWAFAHNHCFDVSVWEMFGALLFGNRLIVANHKTLTDKESFFDLLEKEKITVVNLVPSVFKLLWDIEKTKQRRNLNLAFVMFAGEALLPDHFGGLVDIYPEVRIINMYGITETTIVSTYKEIGLTERTSGLSNIGVPFRNNKVLIVDESFNILPPGIIGEIIIVGSSVAKGYRNKPELTKQRFGLFGIDNEPSYNSGDLGYWLDSGDIIYVGRKDDQIKIRGYRIELSEIRVTIEEFPSVESAFVMVIHDDLNQEKIAAYIRPSGQFDLVSLKSFLFGKLASYMVPTFYGVVEQFPITGNGKINKKALLTLPFISDAAVAADTLPSIAQPLKSLWQELLGKELSWNDNLFARGLDSIRAITAVTRIHSKLGVKIKVKELFFHQTIRDQAQAFDSMIDDSFLPQQASWKASWGEDDNVTVLLPKETEDYFPIADIQKGMLYFHSLTSGERLYREQYVVQFADNNFSLPDFCNAFDVLVKQHPMLRTSFHMTEFPEPIQVVHRSVKSNERIHLEDLSALESTEAQDRITKFLVDDKAEQYDVKVPGQWSVNLFKLRGDEFVMALVFNHVIMDGLSAMMVLTELSGVYYDLKQGKQSEVKTLRSSYRDFVEAEIASRLDKDAIDWWKKELSGYEKLPLPFEVTSISGFQRGNSATYVVALPEDLCSLIKDFSISGGYSIREIMLTAFASLLNITTGKSDVVLGLVTHNRPEKTDGERIIGCFLNTIPLRLDFGSDLSNGLVKFVHDKLSRLKPYENQTLYKISEATGELYEGGNPFFNVFFNFIKFYVTSGAHPESQSRPSTISGRDRNYVPLEWSIKQQDDQISINVTYAPDVVSKANVERLISFNELILRTLVKDELVKITVGKLFNHERERVLSFNPVKVDFPQGSMVDLFRSTSRSLPNLSVSSEEGSMTLSGLDQFTDKIATCLLTEYNLAHGDRVAVLCDRSYLMVAAMMGILKAGAAYVPIDPDYPQDRVDYILESSGAKLVVEGFIKTSDLFKGVDLSCFNLHSRRKELDAVKVGQMPVVKNEDLCYVLYTSGSTGRPKGVMLRHDGIVNRMAWVVKYLGLCADDVVLQKTTATFDVSVPEIFIPLCFGTNSHVCSRSGVHNVDQLVDIIDKHKVTYVHFVPSMLDIFLSELTTDHIQGLSSLRNVVVSGEALLPATASKFFGHLDVALTNLYGPTEASVDVTFHRVRPGDKLIPIGKPIDNARLYVTDSDLELLPVGVPGEICIGGLPLANGYIGRADLTSEKFVSDPNVPGEKIYKTGDIGRWTDDGVLEYLGRADSQVKIRGFRVELGEIENTITCYPGVVKAVVLQHNPGSNSKLVAYVLTDTDIPASVLELYMSTRLAAYMIPSSIIFLSSLPLTATGKVDTGSLRAMQIDQEKTPVVAPQNHLEQTILELFREILQKNEIGVDHKFFENGGHSLKAIQLVSRIRKEVGKSVSLDHLFKHNSVRAIARLIESGSFNDVTKTEPIPRVVNAWLYEVSSIQRRFWLLSQFGTQSAYHIPSAFILKGNLDVDALNHVFRQLVERHEILRTTFVSRDGEAWQVIGAPSDFSIEIINKERPANKSIQIFCEELAFKEATRPFDLSRGPLFRVKVVAIGTNQHLLLITIHHIIGDGVSLEILTNELTLLYNRRHDRKDFALGQLGFQYKDFAAWQNRVVVNRDSAARKFWHSMLSTDIPVLQLPTDKTRPAVKTYNSINVSQKINKDILKRVENLAISLGTSTFIVLVSAIKALFRRYSNQEDMILGVVTSGRDTIELEGQVGPYINTLALRTHTDINDSFNMVVERVNKTFLNAHEHQHYPFELLVEELSPVRDVSRSAFFDVLVVSGNFEGQHGAYELQKNLAELEVQILKSKFSGNKYDLTIYTEINPGDDGYLIWAYNVDVFAADRIKIMQQHYLLLLQCMLEQPSSPIGVHNYITESERRRMETDFNNTIEPFDNTLSLHGMFERSARKFPGNTAVVTSNGARLTYSQLDKISNRVSNALGDIPGEKLVGIICDRNEWIAVGMLGILKSGCGYVPIDPNYPMERQEYIITKSGITKVLADKNYPVFSMIPNTNAILLSNSYLDHFPDTPRKKETDPHSLAYVIYTSGSTGNPKGVMIEHISAVNLVQWVNDEFDINQSDKLLCTTSICFDLSVYDIFGMFATGGTLVLASDITNGSGVIDLLRNEACTFWDSVPTTFDFIVDEIEERYPDESFPSLRTIFLSGDWIPVALFDRSRKPFPNSAFISLGGATEGTVWSNYYPVTSVGADWKSIPYGRPMRNNSFYILDDNLMQVPVGVTGELYIGGIGVARGYMNDAQKTEAAFVPDPFWSGPGKGLMYKTGDLGRMMPNYQMEFLGRKDFQVKIRGFRVEVGEIETIIAKHETVKQVVVSAPFAKDKVRFLVAYVIGPVEDDIKSIRELISKHLPDYMMPSSFVTMDALPLNANGKVDRNKLTVPEQTDSTVDSGATNEIDISLLKICSDLLQRDHIGLHQNFFQLGGHSLTAARLVARVNKHMGVVLSLRDVFLYPVLKDLSAHLSKLKIHASLAQISKAPEMNDYPLSPMQEGLWLLCQDDHASLAYNIVDTVQWIGEFDELAFHAALQSVIERHESLRTSFTMVGNAARQRPGKGTVTARVLDLTEDKSIMVDEVILAEINAKIDLLSQELFRVTLIRLPQQKFACILAIHHIIADEWSLGIIKRDITETYEAITAGRDISLTALEYQYKDFSWWLHEKNRHDIGASALYWTNSLRTLPPPLDLQYDFKRKPRKAYKGGKVSMNIDTINVEYFSQVATAAGTTLFPVLASIVSLFLNKISAVNEMLIGIPMAIRDFPGSEDQVGFYLNTVVLRMKVEEHDTFADLVSANAQLIRDVIDHKYVPLMSVIEKIGFVSTPAQPNLFNVWMALAEGEGGHDNGSSLTTTSKHDLSFLFLLDSEKLSCVLEFDTDLFETDTINLFSGYLLSVMDLVRTEPRKPIEHLKLNKMQTKTSIPEIDFDN